MKKYLALALVPLLALVLAACSTEGAEPSASIAELVGFYGETETLEVAVGEASPGIAATLDGAGSLTLFAPTNEGFGAALDFIAGVCGVEEYTAADLLGVPTGVLDLVLGYHVVGAEVFAADLQDGPVTMFAGGDVTVAGTTLTDGLGRTMNIVRTDLAATNGVVHFIDDVLLPAEAASADLNCP